MQIDLPDSTISDIEAFIAQQDDAIDVEGFIDQSVQRALFFGVAARVQDRNTGSDPAEIDALIDEAVTAVRSRKQDPRADRS